MKRVLLAILVSGFFVQAAHAETSLEDVYPLYCGTKEEVVAVSGGNEPSAEEWKELIEQRSVIIKLLQNPKETLKQVYEESNKNDTGAFGVLMVCAPVLNMRPLLEQKGCLDLKTNQVVRDQGAASLCQSVMDRMPK